MNRENSLESNGGKGRFHGFAKKSIQMVYSRLTLMVLPVGLVLLLVLVFLWNFSHSNIELKHGVALKVWEQKMPFPALDFAEVLGQIAPKKPIQYFETRLSTNPIWFLLTVPKKVGDTGGILDFPSRHASSLMCWDARANVLLGQADRQKTEGVVVASRAGFAIAVNQIQNVPRLLCRGDFRGPANLSVALWEKQALAKAQKIYERSSVALEAGIGMLAATILIAAVVNRSWVYMAFFAWLMLNMRMAAISAGTDLHFFDNIINYNTLIESKKWTICLYFSMTGLIFILIFKNELKKINSELGIKSIKAKIYDEYSS